MRSTVASVVAVIQRMSSGTSVPGPRTDRSISPRFTVSCQTVARSTVGAAGFSLARTTVTKTTTISVATEKRMRLAFLRLATSGERGTSIDESSPQMTGPNFSAAVWLLQTQALCQPVKGQQHTIDERLRGEVASSRERRCTGQWDRSSHDRTPVCGSATDVRAWGLSPSTYAGGTVPGPESIPTSEPPVAGAPRGLRQRLEPGREVAQHARRGDDAEPAQAIRARTATSMTTSAT